MATWNIHGTTEHVALGELQQDTAVGGQLDDGMMSFDNNTINSEEQSAALEHWVEAFEHEMTQNPDPEAAIAALAAKGCPDPEAVAELWIHKQENPDTTEDLNETTPAEEPMMTPAPQDPAQGGQQPLASTKTAASVAEFMNYLEQGSTPEALYAGFDQRAHPMIEEAVRRFQGGGQQAPAPAPASNYDPNALNADVSQSVEDMRGINQQRRGGYGMPERSPGILGQLEQVWDQMRDLGYGGDADDWEHDLINYAPEDYGMALAEAQQELADMHAAGEAAAQQPDQPNCDPRSILPQGQSGNVDPMNADNFTPSHMGGKTAGGDGLDPDHESSTCQCIDCKRQRAEKKEAGLPGDSPRDKKADEIYKAIRRDSDHDKSSAAAIANAEANDLEKKDDLELGNDDDKKDKGNPFAKKDKGDDKDSDSKDDKKDDDKPDFLKKKDARASWNGLDGRISAIFDGQWGDKLILLSTEHGDITVPAGEVEAPVGEDALGASPVDELNEFMSIIDPAGDVPATYHARIHNLAQVVREGRKVINLKTTSLADQIALDEIIVNASAEIEGLRVLAEQFVDNDDQAYLDAQADNAYGIGAGGVFEQTQQGGLDSTWVDEVYHDMMSDVEGTDFDRVVNEEPQLLVDEMPDSALADAGVMHQMALSHIARKTAMVPEPTRTEINNAFVAATEQARRVQLAARKSHMAKTAAQLPDADGPAEGLFL